jgi:hypothetical protein
LNKFIWSIIAAVVVASIYGILVFHRTCSIDHLNDIFSVTASAFALVLNTVLVFTIARDSTNVGDLNNEKSSLILGMTFATVFLVINVLISFQAIGEKTSFC